MANKPVIDIDVNDAKFRRFSELFAKYQAQLGKVPGQWKDVAKAEGAASTEFEKILASFFAMGELQKELTDAGDKDNKNLKKKSDLWQGIKKTTGGVLDDVDKMTKTLLKWGLIGFGAAGAGLLGLRAIASSVSADRRFALGTGLGIGAQDAFTRHQGQFVSDPNAVLTAAFAARSDVSSPAFAALAGLGISSNQSTIGVANAVLRRAQAEARAVPQQFLGTVLQKFPGLSQFGIGIDTLERLRRPDANLNEQIRQFGPDFAQSSLSAKEGTAFQNFETRIDAVFSRISRTFEKDLVPLLPPIEHLVEQIGGIIHTFLTSGAAEKAITSFGNAIERLARYLGSPEFTRSMDNVLKAADYLQHPIQAQASDLADTADVLSGGIPVPQSVLKGQHRLGGDLGQIVKKDQELLGNLGFVNPQDKLRVMLAGFYLSQQKGFDENEFLFRTRQNVYRNQDPLAGQPRAATSYAAQALGDVSVSVRVTDKTNARVTHLAGSN